VRSRPEAGAPPAGPGGDATTGPRVRLAVSVSAIEAAKDVAARVITGVHEFVFKTTDGRLLGRVAGMPVVMLTTTGRKSGKRRTTMLTSPVQNGEVVMSLKAVNFLLCRSAPPTPAEA